VAETAVEAEPAVVDEPVVEPEAVVSEGDGPEETGPAPEG
jgi:hypothetical protein